MPFVKGLRSHQVAVICMLKNLIRLKKIYFHIRSTSAVRPWISIRYSPQLRRGQMRISHGRVASTRHLCGQTLRAAGCKWRFRCKVITLVVLVLHARAKQIMSSVRRGYVYVRSPPDNYKHPSLQKVDFAQRARALTHTRTLYGPIHL